MKSWHNIRTQTLELLVDSESDALLLQPKLSELNQRYLLPVIEKVFDEFDFAGRHVQISSLRLDLGTLTLERLEELAPKRLEDELRQAVERALHDLNHGTSKIDRVLSAEESRLELLQHYLMFGSLPYWGHGAPFDFEQVFLELAESSPEQLADLIKTLGLRTNVLKRLAFQLTESGFRLLVHLLEPAHAALIIAYMIDLRQVHRVERLLEMTDERYTRHLRILVLTYLTFERGSQFNRKSFLKSLLLGIAASEGIDYVSLIRTLELGLQLTKSKHALNSSLPVVIQELLRELAGSASLHDRHSLSTKTERDHSHKVETPGSSLSQLQSFLVSGQGLNPAGAEKEIRSLLRLAPTDAKIELVQALVSPSEPSRQAAIGRLLEFLSLEQLQKLFSLGELTKNLLGIAIDAGERAIVSDALNIGNSFQPARRNVDAQSAFAIASSLFQRYDELESLRYYLRHGLLPWGAVLRVPKITEQSLLKSLTRLPRSLLALAFDAENSHTRLSMIWRATKSLPQTGIDIILVRLLAKAGGAQEPFGRALAETVARVDDLAYFYAKLFATILAGNTIDLDQLASEQTPTAKISDGFSDSLEDWPAHAFQSSLFQFTQANTNIKRPALSRLVQVFLIKYPVEAKAFIKMLPAARNVGKILLRQISWTDFELMIDAVCPRGTESLRAILRTISRMPSTQRPSTIEIREAILCGALDLESGKLPTLEFYSLLLEELIDGDMDNKTRLFLINESSNWPNVSSQEINGFQAAVAALAKLSKEAETTTVDFVGWEAWRFQSAIENQLEHGRTGKDSGFSSLLESYIRLHPDHARKYLESLQRDNRLSRLVTELPGSIVDEIIKVKFPDGGNENGPNFDKPTSLWSRGIDSRYSPLELFAFLSGKSETTHKVQTFSSDEIVNSIRVMVEQSPEELRHCVQKHAVDDRTREGWAKKLPESALVRIVYLLEPHRYRELLDMAEILASAWLQTVAPSDRSRFNRSDYWSFLLQFIATNKQADRTPQRFAKAMFAHLVSRTSAKLPQDESREMGVRLFESAVSLAHGAGQNRLRAVLLNNRGQFLETLSSRGTVLASADFDGRSDPELPSLDQAIVESPSSQSINRPLQTKESSDPSSSRDALLPIKGESADPLIDDAFTAVPIEMQMGETTKRNKRRTLFEQPSESEPDPIYVGNAGLVIAGNFLPRLFDTLEMLEHDEDGKQQFRDPETALRAVHLLQYLVDGSVNTPEPELALNKILVGVPTSSAALASIQMTKVEIEMCDLLLNSVITHWEIIKDTSVSGLQETFIKREGRLTMNDDAWQLRIQRKTVDVLVDRIPWTISVLHHGWMEKPVYVSW